MITIPVLLVIAGLFWAMGRGWLAALLAGLSWIGALAGLGLYGIPRVNERLGTDIRFWLILGSIVLAFRLTGWGCVPSARGRYRQRIAKASCQRRSLATVPARSQARRVSAMPAIFSCARSAARGSSG